MLVEYFTGVFIFDFFNKKQKSFEKTAVKFLCF
jgi:hypothetical protein